MKLEKYIYGNIPKMKYLGINLTKYMKLFHETMAKEIKDQDKYRDIPYS